MSQPQTLINEPDDYNTDAIDTYRLLGPVSLRGIDDFDHREVTLLVVGLSSRVDAPFLDSFPALKAVATPTTGLTHIDLETCKTRGIRIFSLADCRKEILGITSTSELTFGLLIALLRYIPESHVSFVRDGEWDRNRFKSRQLSCMTLGLVGLGRIGGHVAAYARAFGMRVIASDPWIPASRFKESWTERCELEALLELADIVSLHANLRPDNHGLLGARELHRMRPEALLINTARGALLDEHAVATQLRRGLLGGVAVDVLASEHNEKGVDVDSPLRDAAREGFNVIITPHIGGCTRDAMHATELHLARYVAETLRETP